MRSEKQNLFLILTKRRELLGMLIVRNLKIRYKNSALGFLWSLLTPGLFILMYAVFARILRFSGSREGYLAFLITGIVTWQLTVACLNDSLSAIVGNANLVKKVAFPRIILPLSTALANTINFLLTLLVLVAFLIVTKSANLTLWPYLLVAVALQLTLVMGLSCISATSNVFFRDTEHIVGVVAQAWFFLTPIFYPIEMQAGLLPESWHPVLYLNPMTGILAFYRTALLGDPLPAAPGLLVSGLISLLALLVGQVLLNKGDGRFGDVL